MVTARRCLACTLLLVLTGTDALSQERTAMRFSGLRLEEALALLQRDGLRLIFSSEIVRANMRVRAEPSGQAPRDVLDQLLLPHGLMAREGPGGTLLVVRNPRARAPAASPQRPQPAPGPPPLAVPTAEAIEAVRFAVTVDVADEPTGAEAGGLTPLVVRQVEIAALAGGFDNPFRALHALPGVVGTEELGSRIAVRGGGPDQNLTVLDGVEIHNPFRLRMATDDAGHISLASTFNAETIRRLELHPAAFDVRYGDRLSSLLIVEQRDGSETTPLRGSAFFGLTDANLILERQLPKGRSGSWLVSVRRGFVDLVPERVTGSTLPTYHDLQTRAVWRVRPDQQVTFIGSTGRERARPKRDAGRDADQSTRAANAFAGLGFASILGTRVSSRTTLGVSRLDDTLEAFEQSLDNNRSANTPASATTGGPLAFRLTRDAAIADVSMREDLSVALAARHVLDAGAELHRLNTRWQWAIAGDRSLLQANGSSIRLGQALPSTLDSTVRSVRTAAWMQDRWQAGSRFVLQPGVRVDHSTVTSTLTVSPRLSGTLTLASRWRVDLAARLHTQTPGYEKTLLSDYFLDLSDAAARLRPERAWHLAGGVERMLPGGMSVRLDGYYKRFSDLIVGRLETDSQRLARLATYDVPASLAMDVPRDAHITVSPSNEGRGHARGLEVLVSRPATGSSPVSLWTSYSYGRAWRTAYGFTSPFDYDRRHALSVVGSARIGQRLDISASGRWASGLPRTPVRGVRLALSPDETDSDGDGNRTELRPLRDAAGDPLFQPDLGGVSNLNSGRQKGFGRVDLRITHRPRWGGEHWTLQFDVVNALNARNATLVDSVMVFHPDGFRPAIVEVPGDRGLPFFPSFGVRYRF